MSRLNESQTKSLIDQKEDFYELTEKKSQEIK